MSGEVRVTMPRWWLGLVRVTAVVAGTKSEREREREGFSQVDDNGRFVFKY